ncbi:MAG: serine/threonine-protein phosphatase [Clostridia bacterium]|nr:serine/threonine-protein phosphatase [Clostridia bacterium]
MNLFVDASYSAINKYGEELCGDKVDIVRNDDSVIVVLADGLGSGVKASILSTLTSKIIGTMLLHGATIDEAVETIANTLPVCKVRELAYCTFSILQIFKSQEAYLVQFDNPLVVRLRNGELVDIKTTERKINGRRLLESRLKVTHDDVFMMVSDGVIHAGVGGVLNLGWEWEHVAEYLETMYKPDLSAHSVSKHMLSVCNDLYMRKPGDDTTVVTVKIRTPEIVNVMVGPPVDKDKDSIIVNKFIKEEGKKVVCGGTTSQIVSRVTGKKMETNFDYIHPSIPPIANLEGVDLTTEGVLTLGKTLECIRRYMSHYNELEDNLNLEGKDGVSRLSKILLEESTSIHFFVGRAMNPAHQNPEFPLDLGIKLKLVDEIIKHLKSLGKDVVVEYY